MLLLSIGLLGASYVLVASHLGIGLSPDSAVYIAAARSFQQRNGLTIMSATGPEALTHYPPLYPILLGITGALAGDPLDAAVYLNAIIFILTIVVTGHIVFISTRSVALALVSALLVQSSTLMIEIHAMAWSEPLFNLLMVISLYHLVRYITDENQNQLTRSSIFVALAFLTRYTGGALMLGWTASLLLLSHRPRAVRLRAVVLIVAVGSAPLLFWMMNNAFIAGTYTNRSIAWHPPSTGMLSQGIDTMSSWILPRPVPLMARAVVLLAVVALVARGAYGSFRDGLAERNGPTGTLVAVCAIFICSYILYLAPAMMFVDAATRLDGRILSPLFLAGSIVVCALASNTTRRPRSEKAGLLVVCAIALIVGTVRGPFWVERAHVDGLGFASVEWRASKLMGVVRQLPVDVPVFSNAPEAIIVLTGHPASRIPSKVDSTSRLPNDDYDAEMAQMASVIRERGGAVALFSRIDRSMLASEAEVMEVCRFVHVARLEDGALLTTLTDGPNEAKI